MSYSPGLLCGTKGEHMALDTLMQRIESKQLRLESSRCWPWLGHISKKGEARIWVDDAIGSISVPNALMLARGETVPPGKEMLSCPILRDCSNPAHIRVADRTEKIDRILWIKGKKRKEPKLPRHFLSPEEVIQIFLSAAPTSELARHFRVTEGQVANIRHGRRHTAITEPLREYQPQQITNLRNKGGAYAV